ncbi:MAG: hypothetical protein IJV81_05280 [Paludibacteraceae bacterium]|nr:hypothetical protein [Paludibacteraceae bacterium]MBQ9752222.1 hypothetical protein [Paludibacteraceae bacterium]MBR1996571.1 hypothetical protein [Paludibacteraceae bacterium]
MRQYKPRRKEQLTIGHNKRALDQSVNRLYAYMRTIDTIENHCVMSLARFPESVQLRQLLVGGTQQVF